MFRKHNVGFRAEGRIEISAWLLVPEGQAAPLSAITTAHGYAGTKYHGLSPLAEAFADLALSCCCGTTTALRSFSRIEIVLPGVQHRGQRPQAGIELIHCRSRQRQPDGVRRMAG
jgi:hypothetical protein